ncbi:hypothetical protein JOL62DRAFT_432158 [Phyllosticta paracitricarpa]|uniref:DUF6590 domain-containing protein n=1 Tax=Phyllosticta paracitricarpa TaxID=2016321 RepID=A0ABR1NBN0_9PEZI
MVPPNLVGPPPGPSGPSEPPVPREPRVSAFRRNKVYRTIPERPRDGVFHVGKIIQIRLFQDEWDDRTRRILETVKEQPRLVFRRGVIIDCGEETLKCLAIKTYGGQATTHPDVRQRQETHAMVYSSRQPPQLLPGEENLKDAIQAAPLHRSEGLPETARLDYSAAFLVPYDRPVRQLAVITEDSLSTLRLDYAKFVNYEGLRGNDKTWGLRFTASSESLFAGSEWSATPSESTEATSVFEHIRSGSISSQRFDFSSAFQKPQIISEPPPQRAELGDFEVEEPMEEESPSKDLQQTIGSGQTKALELLIENSPETWKNSNFAWIEEMLEMGYDAQEVAALPVEKARDSPWIYSEKHEDPTSNLKVDWHNDSCPHASLTEAADEPAPSDETESLSTASSIASSTERSDVASTVEKLCGLGGIFPWSRYANDCSG